MKTKRLVAIGWLFCLMILCAPTLSARALPTRAVSGQASAVKQFRRTELYFGTAKPDGTTVSDADWNDFLAREITPRFPGGLTVLEGYGQFRAASGQVVGEKSRVLILLYPRAARTSSSRKIEHIRRAYRQQFQQQSVLRVDFQRSVSVSF
jgi:hypothetical protein